MNFKRTVTFLGILIGCAAQAQLFHLYGGADQNQYLGCLNCDDFDKNSVWNTFGDYGNALSSKSIWNTYGNYGSSYSIFSPWSNYASYPPAIVDEDGNFHGFLSLNTYKADKSDLEIAKILCQYHEDIKKDIKGWYSKLFR